MAIPSFYPNSKKVSFSILEKELTIMASKSGKDGKYEQVQKGGGLYTTDLVDPSKAALTMGVSADGIQATAAVPYKKAPQAQHHLQYAAPKKKKGSRSSDRKMSEAQKVERR
jgi:hypothetical protein